MNARTANVIGHRILPHTADLIIEAWAPTRIGCFEEAARALVDSFANISDAPATEPVPFSLDRDGDEGLLAALLEELIYVVDVLGSVPVHIALEETEDGGIAGFFDVATAGGVEVVGPFPKGVSFGDLMFARYDGMWRCRATIDV